LSFSLIVPHELSDNEISKDANKDVFKLVGGTRAIALGPVWAERNGEGIQTSIPVIGDEKEAGRNEESKSKLRRIPE
jgi:hypothetical protein